ncbi:MAG: hypothetical protein [Myoviridae sp. ctThM1]|nr:MAG: hypothetical protein [Myoviridae sp. ctThM1]
MMLLSLIAHDVFFFVTKVCSEREDEEERGFYKHDVVPLMFALYENNLSKLACACQANL